MDGMILYAASDLLWATRIKGTCDAMGVAARPVRSLEMLDGRLGDSDVRGLIVDLEMGEAGIDLIRHFRSRRESLPVVAFGPHVAAEAFRRAADAGASRVIARGGFSDRLPEIIAAIDQAAPPHGTETAG